MNLLYYHVFFFELLFAVNFNVEVLVLANILGKGKDVCGGDGVAIIEPKKGCMGDESKLKVAPLLEPVGDLCHKKEIIVKPAQCSKSTFAKKEEVKPFSFPDFPVDINSALPVPLYPPPAVNCDPSQNPACPPQLIVVMPPPPMVPMLPPEYMHQPLPLEYSQMIPPPVLAPPLEYPQMIPPPPLEYPQMIPPPVMAPPVHPVPPPELFPLQLPPPVQTQIPSPYSASLPIAPVLSPEVLPLQVPPPPVQQPSPIQTQLLPPPSVGEMPNYQLPRCSSCSSQPSPCPSCMAKAQNLQSAQQILPALPESPLQSLPRCPSCSSQAAPCPSCMAKAQNFQPPQQIPPMLPEPSLQSLPRCSSCSGAAAPCNSCAAKAQASSTVQTSSQIQSVLPRCPLCAGSPTPCSSCASKTQENSFADHPYYPETNFIPADAVSQQLAYRAKQEEKIKIEGEIAYGFKTLPIELDQVLPAKERYPEEALFQFNGQVMEFLPETLVLSKTFDPYKGSEVLVAAKVPTPTKKLSLPEIGFGPAIVEPAPYIKKDY